MTFPSLYRQRSDLRRRMRAITHDKSKEAEHKELSKKVDALTLELKRLAGIKPENLQ